MIMQTNNQKFSEYVANPAKIANVDSDSIESMLEKFPFCQLLHAFYSKSLQNLPAFEAQLVQAAIYSPNRKILHAILNHPESLEMPDYASYVRNQKYPAIETIVPDFEAQEVSLNTSKNIEIHQTTHTSVIETIIPDFEEAEATIIALEEVTEQIIQAEKPAHSSLTETDIPDSEAGKASLSASETVEVKQTIHTSLIETIIPDFEKSEASLIALEEITEQTTQGETLIQVSIIETVVPDFEAQEATLTPKEEEDMILGNIASADFFTFEEKLSPRPEKTTPETITETENPVQTETLSRPRQISKYNDDQMPYTFLWWLHKTRNQYAGTYQPYANRELDPSRIAPKQTAGELNQQIIENIFHLQSPLDQLEGENLANTVQFELKRKEEAIIEKFIREEPQIKPPSSDKLDMENKARKSAEDPNDLVSETLAMIYAEQMLFHKAIDTYKKLSLKFPEKRTYFAHQIRELEKKIN
ncbi:MAG TPA: hypothetical protein VEV16_09270 [Daejeonella sp.]|nr:hypothetical protein [Daejeonella sp.]